MKTKEPKISIAPNLERFMRDQVESGRFASESEVVNEGLMRLRQEQLATILGDWTMEQLQEELEPALDQLDRGQGQPWDINEIRELGLSQLAASKNRLKKARK